MPGRDWETPCRSPQRLHMPHSLPRRPWQLDVSWHLLDKPCCASSTTSVINSLPSIPAGQTTASPGHWPAPSPSMGCLTEEGVAKEVALQPRPAGRVLSCSGLRSKLTTLHASWKMCWSSIPRCRICCLQPPKRPCQSLCFFLCQNPVSTKKTNNNKK